MNAADQQLLDRVIKILPHYNAVSARRSWLDIPNVRNERVDYFIISYVLPFLLVMLAYLVLPFLPPKPVELSANLSAFVIAVALSCILSGRVGAWIAAAASLLIIAWLAPPDGSLAIELACLPWFLVASVTFAAIAMIAPPRRRPPPLPRRKNKEHPTHEIVEDLKRRLIIGNRMTITRLR